MSTTHRLKAGPEHFAACVLNIKTFELRKNDRGFRQHDTLILCETRYSAAEMAEGKPLEYTGREIAAFVLHILYGPYPGLAEGYCIMSINGTREVGEAGLWPTRFA